MLERQRAFVKRILGRTGNCRSQLACLLDRQAFGQQQGKHALTFAIVGIGRRAGNHQDELAALPVAVFLEPVERCGQRAGMNGFEHLGQLATNYQRPLAEHGGKISHRFEHAVWRFIKDQGARIFTQLFDRLPALTAFGWQETVKQEMLVEQAGCGQRRRCRARPWQWDDLATGSANRRHDTRARIGNTRRAGIRNQRHRLTRLQALDNPGGGFMFVVLVRRQGTRLRTKLLEQGTAVPRVFRRNPGHGAQNLFSTTRQVGKVSERGRDDIQCSIFFCHFSGMRAKTDDTTTTRGREAETLAARMLERHGLRIVARNFRIRGGEIDLICRDGKTLVFVEVRLRSHRDFGGAGASITSTKQRRIILAARHYLVGKPECDCRFDCVLLDQLDEKRLEWIRDAFSADA